MQFINYQQTVPIKLLTDITYEETQDYENKQDEPLVQFTHQLIDNAWSQTASDIHIEPYQKVCRIRYRIDGILYAVMELPISLMNRIITRLKVMAKVDISEKRLPQDGRFQHKTIDIRMNTCPTLYGEKIVLRLLNNNKMTLDIHQLGLTSDQENIFLEKISEPQGLILVTGPTGSGKTVTLYSALQYLNNDEKNISTVEDPIEIQIKGINQVNINPKIGLHFSTVLRTLLRQDPDIIMVGEIRDQETAEVAIQAAQTGHLVFSTVHSNNALDTIMRLQSMGISSYHIINSISLIIAQRLIRKKCLSCFYGCDYCKQGFKGRTAVFELLVMTNVIKKLIQNKVSHHEILEQAKTEGFIPLFEIGLSKAKESITHIHEIYRAIPK